MTCRLDPVLISCDSCRDAADAGRKEAMREGVQIRSKSIAFRGPFAGVPPGRCDWGSRSVGWLVGYVAPRNLNLLVLLCSVLLLPLITGCATWDPTAAEKSAVLPRAQLTPDAVVLEILTLKTPQNDLQQEGVLDAWRGVDEQVLPPEARRNLAQNGIRCGLIHGQLPAELQGLLDSQRSDSSSLRNLTDEKQPVGNEQRLQTRAGTRGKIVTTDTRDNMVVLTPGPGGLTGRSLQQAQGLFSARSFPRGDGSIDLELTPEVEHGQARQKWVGQAHEGTFRLDMNRECLSLEHLRVRTRLQPGQTLVLGPTQDVKGIGRQFFTEGTSSAPEQRLILIRLAQTQIDDLFAPEPAREPLATPVD